MASSTTKPEESTDTWDSDFQVSSDDDTKSNTPTKNATKLKQNATPIQSKRPSKPKSSPPPPPPPQSSSDDIKEPSKHNDPLHLKLTLLDSYAQSEIYNKIRKRHISKKLNNSNNSPNPTNNNNTNNHIKLTKSAINSEEPSKKITINDLKSHRILYEMNCYSSKWYWIDPLPTDDNNDYNWILQYSNINLFKDIKNDPKNDPKNDEKYDIETEINNNNLIEQISISDFDYNLNELRKSVINSPLFPELGCLGYCKEFYVTLCDWNAEGVLSIKYISEESQRQSNEHKSLQTRDGYWQKLRYQMNISGNGKYLCILFDRYCIIRNYKNNFINDLYYIKLPISFWEYTQFRYIKWSGNNELFAISSYNNNIIIYNYKCQQILAFNCNNNNGKIYGLIWRKYYGHKNNNSNNYWLELIILFSNGELHRRSLEINSQTLEVINFNNNTMITHIQYPHLKIHKWIYDGIDINNEYICISCLPIKLLDTKPRQTRLGHGIMLIKLNNNNNKCIVLSHYNTRIPSNSYFKVDSVCFTMADRRAKLYGRNINISDNGKYILCLDLRSNMELFQCNNNNNGLELECIARIGNTREMSYGSYPSKSRIYSCKWWDNESIIILFCNNTFCITPIMSVKYYNQRDMKWNLNYLGQQREQLYGLPIISNTVKSYNRIDSNDNELKCNENENENENKMFFILEINEQYLRRKDDTHLKYISHETNDIDKKQNEIYGYRKYRNITLSTFTEITSLQLFEKYLNDNKYDKALQIADMFKLKTDKAYQSQFNYLINKYNNENNNRQNNQQEQN